MMDSLNANEGSDSQNIAAKGAALLLVIGEPFSEEHKKCILEEVVKGFNSWNQEACGVDINDELAQIANKADLGEEGPDGERVIRSCSDDLVCEILVNPQTQTLTTAVKHFLCTPTKHKHLIYSGHAFQGSGAWILQDDTYTLGNFASAFKDTDVASAVKQQEGGSLTICTLPEGEWSNGHINKTDFSSSFDVKLNPAEKLETNHGVLQFTAYVGNFVRVRQLNELLQSTDVVGNIRFSRPTLYIFPGCQGDSALFGISGFNLLVNGGFSRKACFWDFTRHLDRIDAALMTHLGTDNLYGFSSVLQRKSIENVHPEIGYMYVNASDKLKALTEDDNKKEGGLLVNLASEGNKLIQYAKQIGQLPQSCSRTSTGQTIEPINLYHKVGIGSLDMYILNPITDSKEMKEFYQQWNQNVAQFGTNQHLPLPNTLSVCALLVWRPSDPKDNITRIFFPGNAPQHKVIEGLEKLKSLDILKHPVCNRETLTAKPAAKKAAGSATKMPARSKISPVSTPRTEVAKKEPAAPKLSSTPKSKAASAPKAKKEDSNKKTSKIADKASKEEKTDKTKSQASSPSKASTKSSTPSTPKQLVSPVKEPSKSKKTESKPKSKPEEPAPLVQGLEADLLTNGVGSSVDPPALSNDLLEPTPVNVEPEVEQPAPLTDPPQISPEAEPAIMDKNKMIELGIYDDEHDIEGDLNAQKNNVAEEAPAFGGMTESMHEDLMGSMNARNAMQSSFHGDLMTGSMHESMYDSKQPFDDPAFGVNDHSAIEELTTPEDDTSEEVQPQALPEPMAYTPASYGQEPDVIPAMPVKEEPAEVHKQDGDMVTKEPDLLQVKQDLDDVSASHGLGEESTAPVDDKFAAAPVELETPDEVENHFPEDEGFSQPAVEDVQEKDVTEENEKETAVPEKTDSSEPEVDDSFVTPDQSKGDDIKVNETVVEEEMFSKEEKQTEQSPFMSEDSEYGVNKEDDMKQSPSPSDHEEETVPQQDAFDLIPKGMEQSPLLPEDLDQGSFAAENVEQVPLEPEQEQVIHEPEEALLEPEQAPPAAEQAPPKPESPFQPEHVSPEPDQAEQAQFEKESLVEPQAFEQSPLVPEKMDAPVSDQEEELDDENLVQEDEQKDSVPKERQPSYFLSMESDTLVSSKEDSSIEQRDEDIQDLPESQQPLEDFGFMPETSSQVSSQLPDEDLDKDHRLDLSPDQEVQRAQDRPDSPDDVIERPKSPEPVEIDQAENRLIDTGIPTDSLYGKPGSPALMGTEGEDGELDHPESEMIENDYLEGEENVNQPESLQMESQLQGGQPDFRPETPESIGDRADSPDSQNRDSLEREVVQELAKPMEAGVQRDSIERDVEQSDGSERESIPRDSIERDENQAPVSSDDQRDSVERSYEDDSEDSEEEDEGEESSSFEQEENTDERCLIQDSVSERLDEHDGKPMDADSLAAPFDSLMEQPSDNLLTPESEVTDQSHGGQLGYHQIGEQDDVDSVEDVKDDFGAHPPPPSHPFGQDFEDFGAPTRQSGPMSYPFETGPQTGLNPFVGLDQQQSSQPQGPFEDSSPEDEFGSRGGPASFNPLAEWGEPMGLPSPPPPEEKAAKTNGVASAKKSPRPKSATKPADPKKTGAEAKKAAADAKKPETKRPPSATKKPPSTKSAPKTTNGVPEKSKSRLAATGNKDSTDTSRSSPSSSLNNSKLASGPAKSAKSRPASAPVKDSTAQKSKTNGAKRPATATGTKAASAAVKMPPLPAFTPFYVDLTYIPNHGNPSYSDIEFFKRIRARYYVLSALSPDPQILDALLQAKNTWEDKNLPVTVIPTYDNETLRLWMTLHKDKLAENKIEIAPSASRCTIQLQDHETSSSAYRLEF